MVSAKNVVSDAWCRAPAGLSQVQVQPNLHELACQAVYGLLQETKPSISSKASGGIDFDCVGRVGTLRTRAGSSSWR